MRKFLEQLWSATLADSRSSVHEEILLQAGRLYLCALDGERGTRGSRSTLRIFLPAPR